MSMEMKNVKYQIYEETSDVTDTFRVSCTDNKTCDELYILKC